MKNLSSILLLVERGDQGHQALHKALLLARHLHARLELFLCDTERHSCRVAEAREYLRSLRKTMVVPDIRLSSDAVCRVSLRAALADKLRQGRVDLVVKAGHATEDSRGYGAIDWPLVASCTAPLLLTRGRPWHPVPRFAAAVDLQDRRGRGLCSAITAIGESLSRACGAELEVLFAHADTDGEMAGDRLSSTLSAIARTHRLDADRLQYLHGEPSEVLPGVVVRRDYDLVVMGKPRNGGQPDPARSVAARVVKASAGDVLFAPPVAGRSGVVVRGRAAAGLSGDSRGRRQREL